MKNLRMKKKPHKTKYFINFYIPENLEHYFDPGVRNF